jgi:hypothetical protein
MQYFHMSFRLFGHMSTIPRADQCAGFNDSIVVYSKLNAQMIHALFVNLSAIQCLMSDYSTTTPADRGQRASKRAGRLEKSRNTCWII